MNGVKTVALVDTGSPATIISLDYVMKILASHRLYSVLLEQWRKQTLQKFSPPDVALKSHGGHSMDLVSQILLRLALGKKQVETVVLLQKGAPNDLLLGTDTQPRFGIALVIQNADMFTQSPVNPQDSSRSQDDSRSLDDSRAQDDSRSQDSSRSQDDSRSQDNSRAQDDSRSQDSSRSQDDSRPQDDSRSPDQHKPQENSRPQDNSGSQENPRPQDNPKPQLNPRPKNQSQPRCSSRPASNHTRLNHGLPPGPSYTPTEQGVTTNVPKCWSEA